MLNIRQIYQTFSKILILGYPPNSANLQVFCFGRIFCSNILQNIMPKQGFGRTLLKKLHSEYSDTKSGGTYNMKSLYGELKPFYNTCYSSWEIQVSPTVQSAKHTSSILAAICLCQWNFVWQPKYCSSTLVNATVGETRISQKQWQVPQNGFGAP